ncbi:coproporphyrinogen dehydrogenase HemZ [Sedimentibacter sp.]|uniref:coproporphyrinogen dehydrogenase HemZ n=1 Tax=Sedimentibacter sp. TaxID=1960295 RepID=UPI00289B39A7|nr:coproporphyrinogen dehydrogenase HemZ [Sedimentibacter sp.]
MLKFYLKGHNFEYESRNALRVFDLNLHYAVEYCDKLSDTDKEGLSLMSILKEEDDKISGEAYLYENGALLHHAVFRREEILLESGNEKKLKKTLVVKAIHNVLKKYYNVEPDYGILTGVRVIKIMITAKNNLKNDDEINSILKSTYEVKDDKIKLLWDILKIEGRYISSQNISNYNLYIGIPFCPSKCSYCSFTSFVNTKEDKINIYLKTLIYEIEKTIELAMKKDMNLNTVYIGGGTPSVLNEDQIDSIFSAIGRYYDLTKIKEITFEAGRPDTLSREKLECLKRNYVNRISINPQTMNEKTLNLVGRSHTVEDIIQKYRLSREAGFNSINMDVILGLPGEDETDVKNTITEIVKLRPENITVHSLAYKKKSELTRETREMSKDYDLISKMHEVVNEECQSSGYAPYYMYRQKNIKGNSENIGFTLSEKECIYNMVIIEELETILACGLGASSKILQNNGRHEPIRNFKSLEEYNGRINEIINKKMELLS